VQEGARKGCQLKSRVPRAEAGAVPTHSAVNILMKNMVDMAVGSLAFFMFGWAFAYGKEGNAFSGTSQFFLVDLDRPSVYVFQFAFAAASATILSGAVAGRLKFKFYILISFLVTGFIYPFIAHAFWDPKGWLFKMGIVDFAGSGVVHLTGGTLGLISTLTLGARIGVFNAAGVYFPTRSNPSTAIFGVFILWWCWFAFNSGSSGGMSNGGDILAARAAMRTGLSSGAGMLTAMFMSYYLTGSRYFDAYDTITGVLTSLVGVTARCASIDAWEAVIIGAFAAACGVLSTRLLVRFRIDDPVGVVPAHFVGGIIGIVAVGLFSHGKEGYAGEHAGLFRGGGFYLLGIQLLGLVFVLAWSGVLGVVIFVGLHRTVGLRVSEEHELRGLDEVEHNMVQVRVIDFDDTTTGMGEDGANGSRKGKGNRRRSMVRNISERNFMTTDEIRARAQEDNSDIVLRRPGSYMREKSRRTIGASAIAPDGEPFDDAEVGAEPVEDDEGGSVAGAVASALVPGVQGDTTLTAVVSSVVGDPLHDEPDRE